MTDCMYIYVRKDGIAETWRGKKFSDGNHPVFHDEDYDSVEEAALCLTIAGYIMVGRYTPESSISAWVETAEVWAKVAV